MLERRGNLVVAGKDEAHVGHNLNHCRPNAPIEARDTLVAIDEPRGLHKASVVLVR